MSCTGAQMAARVGCRSRVCMKSLFPAFRAKFYFEGLCKKSFAAFGGRIFFWETRHFRENDVSLKT
jgi:hypothetical protein